MRYDLTTALVVVDVQNDFADLAGSLSVRGGEAVVLAANAAVAAPRAAGARAALPPRRRPRAGGGGGGRWTSGARGARRSSRAAGSGHRPRPRPCFAAVVRAEELGLLRHNGDLPPPRRHGDREGAADERELPPRASAIA